MFETPSMVEMERARIVSAYSSTTGSDRVAELSVIWIMVWSDGLDLKNVGGAGMVGGSWRVALEIAAWTSFAAASMLRSSRNCSVMRVVPSVFWEFIASSPAIFEN